MKAKISKGLFAGFVGTIIDQDETNLAKIRLDDRSKVVVVTKNYTPMPANEQQPDRLRTRLKEYIEELTEMREFSITNSGSEPLWLAACIKDLYRILEETDPDDEERVG